MKTENDYVKIASYVFIKEYRRRFGQNPNGILFNGFMICLDNDLKKEGIDIRLPHCWFIWGNEVVRSCVPYISWAHEDLDKTSLDFNERMFDFDSNERNVAIIERYTNTFIDDCDSGKGDIASSLERMRSGAPFEFQNDFRALMEYLNTSHKKVLNAKFNDHTVSLLAKCEQSFSKGFGGIRKEFNQFLIVFRESVKAKASIDDIFEFTEYFWIFFCHSLRLNRKCHMNVPIDTIYQWRCALSHECDRFEKNIQIFADKMCPESEDRTVKKILRDMEIRFRELKELLDEME